MYITYSALSCELVTRLSTFPIFIFLVKMINIYEDYVNFQDIEHQLEENTLHHILHYSLL